MMFVMVIRAQRRTVIAEVTAVLVILAALGAHSSASDARASRYVASAAKPKPSPLSKRRRLPAGIRAQLRRVTGQGDPPACTEDRVVAVPQLTFWTYKSINEVRHGGRLELAQRGFLCAYGFSPAGSSNRLILRVERPDGVVQTRRVPVKGAPYRYAIDGWVAVPPDPFGLYRVTATQGARRATTSFRVIPPERPTLFVLDPDQSFVPVQRLGSPLTIALAGLPSRAFVWLDLYRTRERVQAGRPRYRYFNSVRVRVREDGTLLYRLRTSRDDRPAVYSIVLRRRRSQLAEGCFTMVHGSRRGAGLCASG